MDTLHAATSLFHCWAVGFTAGGTKCCRSNNEALRAATPPPRLRFTAGETKCYQSNNEALRAAIPPQRLKIVDRD